MEGEGPPVGLVGVPVVPRVTGLAAVRNVPDRVVVLPLSELPRAGPGPAAERLRCSPERDRPAGLAPSSIKIPRRSIVRHAKIRLEET